MINDPKILKLFAALLNGENRELIPVFSPKLEKGIDYPFAREVLEKSPAFTIQLLDDLTRNGYLKKKFYNKILVCPICRSTDLHYLTFCPKCGSEFILKSQVLEHFSCGLIAPVEEFMNETSYFCPKCHRELKMIGSDYNNPGFYYKCQECGELVINPVEKWRCAPCQTTFRKEEVKELALYSYEINRTSLEQIHKERIPKDRIQEILLRDGYEVQSSVKVMGRSGAEHEIDLLATKKSGPFEHRIVVGFAQAENEVDSEEVIKLYAKAYDVNAQDIILIAIPRLSNDAIHFTKHYRIKVFELADLDTLETAFQSPK